MKPDWIEALWHAVGICTVIATGLLAWTILSAPRTVAQYYVGHSQSSNGSASCVMASIDWDQDPAVFCSDDVNKVIEAMQKMNAALVKK